MSDFEQEISGQPTQASPYDSRDIEALRHVLKTRHGRRFVYSLLGVCHFGRSAFGGTNEITNHLTGKQAVGEHVMGLLNLTSPEAFSLMVKEANEDEKHDRRIDERNRADHDHANTIDPDGKRADANDDQPR